jgi:hypothetical protein
MKYDYAAKAPRYDNPLWKGDAELCFTDQDRQGSLACWLIDIGWDECGRVSFLGRRRFLKFKEYACSDFSS